MSQVLFRLVKLYKLLEGYAFARYLRPAVISICGPTYALIRFILNSQFSLDNCYSVQCVSFQARHFDPQTSIRLSGAQPRHQTAPCQKSHPSRDNGILMLPLLVSHEGSTRLCASTPAACRDRLARWRAYLKRAPETLVAIRSQA